MAMSALCSAPFCASSLRVFLVSWFLPLHSLVYLKGSKSVWLYAEAKVKYILVFN